MLAATVQLLFISPVFVGLVMIPITYVNIIVIAWIEESSIPEVKPDRSRKTISEINSQVVNKSAV